MKVLLKRTETLEVLLDARSHDLIVRERFTEEPELLRFSVDVVIKKFLLHCRRQREVSVDSPPVKFACEGVWHALRFTGPVPKCKHCHAATQNSHHVDLVFAMFEGERQALCCSVAARVLEAGDRSIILDSL